VLIFKWNICQDLFFFPTVVSSFQPFLSRLSVVPVKWLVLLSDTLIAFVTWPKPTVYLFLRNAFDNVFGRICLCVLMLCSFAMSVYYCHFYYLLFRTFMDSSDCVAFMLIDFYVLNSVLLWFLYELIACCRLTLPVLCWLFLHTSHAFWFSFRWISTVYQRIISSLYRCCCK